MNGLLLNNLKSDHQIFQEEGLLFYPQLFTGDELERLRVANEYVLDQHRVESAARNPAGAAIEVSMRHVNNPRWFRENQEHWKTIMETAADPRCLGPVEQIFRGTSLFRSTTLWFNPATGTTEGDWHRDHQFILPNEDEVAAYFDDLNSGKEVGMNGVQFQIALIDSEDVEYVPYSASRYDSPQEYYFRCADGRGHNREAGMPNAMRLRQRAGDAIVFNPAGLHRGRYHFDKPRRTFMLTYTPRRQPTFDFFSNQPWMREPGILDNLSGRARVYFEDFIEVYREFWESK